MALQRAVSLHAESSLFFGLLPCACPVRILFLLMLLQKDVSGIFNSVPFVRKSTFLFGGRNKDAFIL